jgi:hypothetical protein
MGKAHAARPLTARRPTKFHLFKLFNEIARGSERVSSHQSTPVPALAFQKGAVVTRFDQSLRENRWAFVPNIARSNNDRAFVHTLIDLSHRLGVKSVAERVQDEETAALLNGRGCDYLQGELIGLATSERTWQVEKE